MKAVIIIDEALPLGVSANAVAVLAFSASPSLPSCVGETVLDASGNEHRGITNIPFPILAAPATELASLKDRAAESPDISCIDFSSLAQKARSYAEYSQALGQASSEELQYLGLCLFGADASVRALTGSLPLYGRPAKG